MKLYEKPVAELIDFTAECIMDGDGEGGNGPSDIQQGAGDTPW